MTATESHSLVSDEQRAIYERDGVVCLRGLLSEEWIETLRAAVAEVMSTTSQYSRDFAKEGGRSGSFFNEINVRERNETLNRFLFDSPISAAAAEVMGSKEVRFFSDQLLVKEPGTDAPTLWHQDFTYFPCDGDQICSVWLGLDPVTEETGAMSFVKGSHRAGKLYTPQSFATAREYDADPFDGPVPDIDGNPDLYPTVCYAMEPGDVTIHHGITLHGAKGNSSKTIRRRGYTIRMAGDDILFRKRRHISRGFEHLEDGAKLTGDRYPILYSSQA